MLQPETFEPSIVALAEEEVFPLIVFGVNSLFKLFGVCFAIVGLSSLVKSAAYSQSAGSLRDALSTRWGGITAFIVGVAFMGAPKVLGILSASLLQRSSNILAYSSSSIGNAEVSSTESAIFLVAIGLGWFSIARGFFASYRVARSSGDGRSWTEPVVFIFSGVILANPDVSIDLLKNTLSLT